MSALFADFEVKWKNAIDTGTLSSTCGRTQVRTRGGTQVRCLRYWLTYERTLAHDHVDLAGWDPALIAEATQKVSRQLEELHATITELFGGDGKKAERVMTRYWAEQHVTVRAES